MCGIFGFTGNTSPPTLRKMGQSLFHRGPDDEGFYEDDEISLGMRRLSIVDIETGYQPVSNESKTTITVCNGEIYNHKELRNELSTKGHIFHRSHSDIETIVHLYEDHGTHWPRKVNGMFGAAIWDKKERKLSLYRDRIGKKPLYYCIQNNNIVFASEIKALLQYPAISDELDFNSLYHYFSNKNVSAPNTAYKGISELLPGHVLTWQKGKISTKPFWNISFRQKISGYQEDEIAYQLLELYRDAVKLRMQCDAPYGAYLSGGVDSSSVVAIMTQFESKPIKTFCLGYEDKKYGQFKGKEQDLLIAREISERLGTEHHELIINSNDFVKYLPSILGAFDAPFSGTISTYFLSQLIKEHVKVALSGDGADELFGSYLAHRLATPVFNYFNHDLNKAGTFQDLSNYQKNLLTPFDTHEQYEFLKKIASPSLSTWRHNLSVFSDQEKLKLLSQDFIDLVDRKSLKTNIYATLEPSLTTENTLDKNLEIDQKELLPNQVLPFVDRLSMAHSIEVRCPFLDYRIIEFANSIPPGLKIKHDIVKYIHKKSVKDLLPKEILQRPKEGFVQPIFSWMRTSLQPFVIEAINSLPKPFFNQDYIEELKTSFKNGDNTVNSKIWNLACFSIWWNTRSST